MARHFYPAIFQQEANGYSVSFPDLPGCRTEGDTLDEAYEMACDAVGLYLESLAETEYPAKSNPKGFTLETDQFAVLVEFDKLKYEKKHNTKAVKKTLTIPAWLNDLAEENHVNFSGLLQAALKEKLQVE